MGFFQKILNKFNKKQTNPKPIKTNNYNKVYSTPESELEECGACSGSGEVASDIGGLLTECGCCEGKGVC